MGPLLEINFTSDRPKEQGDRARGEAGHEGDAPLFCCSLQKW